MIAGKKVSFKLAYAINYAIREKKTMKDGTKINAFKQTRRYRL